MEWRLPDTSKWGYEQAMADEMSEYSITVKHEPENFTGFEKGTVLTYEKSDASLLVIGEDDVYLHTFTPTGNYYGILKAKPNLECLVTVEPG